MAGNFSILWSPDNPNHLQACPNRFKPPEANRKVSYESVNKFAKGDIYGVPTNGVPVARGPANQPWKGCQLKKEPRDSDFATWPSRPAQALPRWRPKLANSEGAEGPRPDCGPRAAFDGREFRAVGGNLRLPNYVSLFVGDSQNVLCWFPF